MNGLTRDFEMIDKTKLFNEITNHDSNYDDSTLIAIFSEMSGVKVNQTMIDIARNGICGPIKEHIKVCIPVAVRNLKNAEFFIESDLVIRCFRHSDFCFFKDDLITFFIECNFIFDDELKELVEYYKNIDL